jgi:hypothetical protein
MTEHRLAFAFTGLTPRQFAKLARRIDGFVEGAAPRGTTYEVFAEPDGPEDWPDTGVHVALRGSRKERAKPDG